MGAKTVVKRGLSRSVKVAAAGVDLVRPIGEGLVVLIYHRVGDRNAVEIDLPTATFDRQVAELAESGRLVSLDDGLARLAAGEVRDRPVVLTFDDGTADWIDEVAPVLVRHGAPATFYVATAFVDEQRPFPSDGRPISWGGLRDLHATGLATIGSHTHTHALLDRVEGTTAATELQRSVDRLGEELGVECRHFAYPKALLGSAAAEGEVRRRFASATLAGTRLNARGADVHRLHRSPIQRGDGMGWFRRKAAGGLRFEDDARRMLNRSRYPGRDDVKVVVTGAAGFVGSHLAERLATDGHDVVGIDAFTPYYDLRAKELAAEAVERAGARIERLDLRTDDLAPHLEGVDAVFHQAAQPGVRASWDDRFADYATHNVLGTQRLLEAARHAGVGRFVYASSSSIYGNALTYPTVEDTPPAPFSPYGVTKLAGEHLCRAYAQNFGFPTVSLRYFTVYGPRQRPDMGIHRLIRSSLTGEPFPLFGDGTQIREFTHVADVVAANILAMDADVPPGTVLNISGGSEIALRDLIDLVGQIVGQAVVVDPRPPEPGDIDRNGGSTAAAGAVLGWSPTVGIEEGIATEVEWLRSSPLLHEAIDGAST